MSLIKYIEELERQLAEITAQNASLMLEQTMRKAGEQSNIKLIKQLAERDAELQKHRDAPVVVYMYKSEDPFDAGDWLISHDKINRREIKPLIVKPGE